MAENFRSAFQGIWSHKMRSFLTMLGVIIGIASIIAIVSAIQGTNDQIMQSLIGAGNNCVTVQLQQGSDEYYMDGGLPQGVSVVTDDQIERIRGLAEVQDASFYTKRSYASGIWAGEKSLDGGGIMGIDTHYLRTAGYVAYKGRGFVQADYEDMHKVALIDQNAADALFPGGDAVGSVIEIQGEPFNVVGVVKKDSSSEMVINSMQDYMNYHSEDMGMVYIPDICWPIVYQFDEPKNCIVRAKTTEQMSSAGKDAAGIMSECVTDSGSDLAYKAEDLLEKAKNKQELSRSSNNMLIWIASIALLVGGIGVMNIMLVSVSERTPEIGLKKALGAKKKTIMAQFLTESAMLTSIGGVIGVIAGIVLAEVIAKMSKTPVSISVPAIILGVAFSMLIGILFGLLPSVKAANLNPIDALRRE